MMMFNSVAQYSISSVYFDINLISTNNDATILLVELYDL
jgi:hypothetical protein